MKLLKKRKRNFAFIDAQNLHIGIQSQHWNLDFQKFRSFLKHRYGVEKAFLFIGFVPGNELLYSALQKAGYILVHKPTVEHQGTIKGNCDAELVLSCMKELENFDQAVIVSGDGDFHCLIEFLAQKKKLLKIGIPNKNCSSSLLKDYSKYFFYVSDFKKQLSYFVKRIIITQHKVKVLI